VARIHSWGITLLSTSERIDMDKITYRRWHTFGGTPTDPEITSETQYNRIHDWATQEMARTGDKYIKRSKFVDTGDGYEEVPHTED